MCIYLINPNIFTEQDFLPSNITARSRWNKYVQYIIFNIRYWHKRGTCAVYFYCILDQLPIIAMKGQISIEAENISVIGIEIANPLPSTSTVLKSQLVNDTTPHFLLLSQIFSIYWKRKILALDVKKEKIRTRIKKERGKKNKSGKRKLKCSNTEP